MHKQVHQTQDKRLVDGGQQIGEIRSKLVLAGALFQDGGRQAPPDDRLPAPGLIDLPERAGSQGSW